MSEPATGPDENAWWEGGLIDLAPGAGVSGWVPCWLDAAGEPVGDGSVLGEEAEAAEALVTNLLAAVAEYGAPGELRVQGAALSEAVRAAAEASGGLAGVAVMVPEAMPRFDAFADSLRESVNQMAEEVAGSGDVGGMLAEALGEESGLDPVMLSRMFGSLPSILDGEGVGESHAAAFAHAAQSLHDAAPWSALPPLHLFRVEGADGAAPPAGMAYVNVIGAEGTQLGLTFYDSPEAFAAFREEAADPDLGNPMSLFEKERWTLTWDTAEDVADGTLALWQAMDLPTAPPLPGDQEKRRLFPVPLAFGPEGPQTPDKARLIFLTRLCETLSGFNLAAPTAPLIRDDLKLKRVELEGK